MHMAVRRVLPRLTLPEGEAPMSSGKALVAQGGEKAVQFAMWGDRRGSVAIKRTGFCSVAFRLYLRPLRGSGMPGAFRLRTHQVPKVLRP